MLSPSPLIVAVSLLIAVPYCHAGIGPQPELSLTNLLAHQSPPNTIQVRAPPTLSFSASSDVWVSTPPNWLYGTWFFTHSNQPLYYTLRNLLWTLAPLEPNDSAYPLPNPILADITSFQHWNTSTDQDPAGGKTFYFYAVDTAVRHVGPDVYHSVPDSRPANLLNNTYEILSWGFDSVGTPFLLLYETRAIDQTGDSLDVVSRAPDGPTKATMLQIAKGVHSLNDSAVSALWEKVGKLRQDSEREGLPWPLCNETCMTGGYER